MTSDSEDGRPAFLSTLPAGRGDRRLALAVVLGSGAIFLAAAPFATRPLGRVEAFIPIYQSALVILDLITAALLYGQFRFLGSRALCVLAGGYLFTALMAVAHMLTFPGLFAPAGLLGAGPQSTAWLYMFWHGTFPFSVMGYALWRRQESDASTPSGPAIVGSIAAVVGVVGTFTLLATAGHEALPAIMRGNHYAPAMLAVVSSTWVISALALIVLWTGRPHTVLDVWLMVVMWVWIFDIALSAVLNAGRFDLGFYAGRVYGLLAATFVLGVLLVENGLLYARLAGAHLTLGRQARALEETVRERTQGLAAIVENSDDAIISKDLGGMITSWNASAERIFGFRADEAIGRSIQLIIPPDRWREEDDVLGRLRRGERIDHFETVRQTRDGRLIDVSLTISPVRDADGRIVGASKIARDITERKRADEALRQSEARALALIDSAAEGILIVDEEGRIVAANGQVEAMFGHSERDLVGQPMEILLPERLRARHAHHRAEYAGDPRVRSMGRGLDLSGRRRDGSEFPVEISLSYVRMSGGLHVMAFITDITERLALERAARQADKLTALGTLAAGIAHEVNNPLGIILGRIEVMLLEDEDEKLAPEVHEDLGVIHRQAQRVVRLVQSLLSYARPVASGRAPVDVNRAVDEVLLFAEGQLAKGGVRLVASLDRGLPPTFGDVGGLEQVLLNLVTNARQAMEGAGEIRIVTRSAPAHPGWIEVVVSDTGSGIPAEVLSRIFDPFFTTKAGGTGLGLSISQRIVQEHGGVIEVASSPGEGTVFVLRFPAANGGGEQT